MPTKGCQGAYHTASTPHRPTAVRPPGLAELWARLHRQTREIAKLSRERDHPADDNQKAIAYHRHLLAEASDKWWTCIDKITALNGARIHRLAPEGRRADRG